jgi:hypothetical protein
MGTTNNYMVIDKHGRRGYVYADTSYEAQQKGARMMGAKKSYDVTVILLQVDNKDVVHSTSSI